MMFNAIQAQNIQVAPGNIGGEPAHPRTELQLTLTTKGRLITPEEFSRIILKRGEDGQLGCVQSGVYGDRPGGARRCVCANSDATISTVARAQGWPAELLWDTEPWGSPRGLASVLDESDAISERLRREGLERWLN